MIPLLAQQSLTQDYVTYEKKSDFIKEFKIPINERGLKGVTTDSGGNVWLYHATSNGSIIIKMSQEGANFIKYNIPGNTTADTAVINLAGGQLLFDNITDTIWFTDARTNSVGKLEVKSSKIELFSIPTNNSGIMGLALSPDRKVVWFTEITGNNIGSIDTESKKITEYSTGENSGPAFLTFDSKGILWVTLSYANSIVRVEPWLLIPGITSSGMYRISLEKPDFFSPFGIATIKVKGIEKIAVSDHGSSRVIIANLDPALKNSTSYWTSPSQALPMSLPSQVVSDKAGNIFFVQHGGNKIAKISSGDGLMTEFDIPTGPLATSVFLTVSQDMKRIWFTEWASNKIAYLNNTVKLPLSMIVRNNESVPINKEDMKAAVLREGESFSVEVALTLDEKISSLEFANDTELSVVGMTDTGLQGLVYLSKPSSVNLMEVPDSQAMIQIKVEGEKAIAGNYTIMIRSSVLEKDNLILSVLYPQLVRLDVPTKVSKINEIQNFQKFPSKNTEAYESSALLFRDLIRYSAIGVAIVLVAYLFYLKIGRRIKFKKS